MLGTWASAQCPGDGEALLNFFSGHRKNLCSWGNPWQTLLGFLLGDVDSGLVVNGVLILFIFILCQLLLGYD